MAANVHAYSQSVSQEMTNIGEKVPVRNISFLGFEFWQLFHIRERKI